MSDELLTKEEIKQIYGWWDEITNDLTKFPSYWDLTSFGEMVAFEQLSKFKGWKSPEEVAEIQIELGSKAFEKGKVLERERIIKYLKDNTEVAFGIPYIKHEVLEALKDKP